MMKIGEKTYKTGAPDAAQLLEATGLSPDEMARELAGSRPLAGTVAAALNACLEKPLERQALASEIEAHGVDEVRAEVLKLYSPEKKQKPEQNG